MTAENSDSDIRQNIEDKILNRFPHAIRIAVFDVNHGAVSLASAFRAFGFETIAFDVYEKMSDEKKKSLSDASGIPISVSLDDVDGSDVVFSPVHLTPENRFMKRAAELHIPVMTHHEAAGILLKHDSRLKNKCLIEITGVRGKTSTATVFARMVSALGQTALHTSRGIEIYELAENICDVSVKLIRAGGTISPSHIPEIIDEILNAGYDPAFFIFEISLGCTGAADISMITTLNPAYGVAGNSSDSTAAKTAFIRHGCGRNGIPGILAASENDRKAIENAISKSKGEIFSDVLYYGWDSSEISMFQKKPEESEFEISEFEISEFEISEFEISEFEISESEISGYDIFLTAGNSEFEIESLKFSRFLSGHLPGGLFMKAYLPAFAGAASLALAVDIPDDSIISAIETFEGIEGRMKEMTISGRRILDNSNSGLNESSARAGIEHMLKKETGSGKIILVIGENAREVCEGFSPESVERIVRDYAGKIQEFILIGERMKSITEKLNASGISVKTAAKQTDGMELALKMSDECDIIISEVKCFR